MSKYKFPQFFRFIKPIVEALKDLGGSGKASEVTDRVVEKMSITEEELSQTIKSGISRIKNQIGWARFVLVKAGYLDSSHRGVWSLTEKAYKEKITDEILCQLYKRKKELAKVTTGAAKNKKPELYTSYETDDEDVEQQENYKTEIMKILLSLPPSGFEKLCQRLLRESGFEQVVVTGKTGDGGIDGHGVLQVNPFVSFSVFFQSKRFKGSVSASQIRDFRGAMLGRADKGIVITTGSFTLDAKKEARRDGVPPIELVDGEKLIEMFEELELGLKPKKDFEVDPEFFKEFYH